MDTFLSSIVGPILALDLDYITNPAKREDSPLPAKAAIYPYPSLQDYVETMQHALLHETLQTVGSDYDDRECLGDFRLEVNGYERSRSADQRHVLDCEITVEALAAVSRQLPDGRKAEFFIQDSTVGMIKTDDGKKSALAFITDKNRRRHRHSPYFELRVEIFHHDPAFSNAFFVTFQSFSNLVPSRRLFEALSRMHETAFRHCFVNPLPDVFRHELSSSSFSDDVEQRLAASSFHLNDSQRRAISTAASMVLDKTAPPEMTLIQGPPGTGKTQTVAALIESLVINGAVYAGPILVCAPSNTAVDQILRRIDETASLASLREFTHRVGTRVGTSKAVRHYHVGDGDLNDVQAKLKDAMLVFTTLNSAGSNQLKQLRHPCCLIVDEAGQSTDLEFLIPIVKFRIAKVVVVGDPLQLPPTVLSFEAERLGFKRSFMERCYVELRRLGRSEKMLKLNIQFRMDPEICRFPCRHFYDGLFATHRNVLKRDGLPLNPYLVLNLRNTEESRCSTGGNSRSNVKEARFIVRLVEAVVDILTETGTMMRRDKTTTIGVITPYLSQMRSLNRLIAAVRVDIGKRKENARNGTDGAENLGSLTRDRKTDGNNNDHDDDFTQKLQSMNLNDDIKREPDIRPLSELVDVRTIDSFQGDERDVIVFSCVRAADADSASGRTRGGVGFVGDRHRMNVALTRAREALYVVGDMETLAENADWKALRDDAAERNLIVEMCGRVVGASASSDGSDDVSDGVLRDTLRRM